MILFLAVALSIYTTMHCLVFWGIYPLLAGHRLLITTVVLLMLIMIIAPIGVRLLDAGGNPQIARLLALTAYSWMGLVFLAFSMFAVIGLIELLAYILSFIIAALPRLTVHRPIIALGVLLMTLFTGLYGYVAAKNTRVVTVPIQTDKLPASVDQLRVVQVSDIHLGLLNRAAFLAPIISRIKELKPDLLVATGDVVDAQINHLDGLDAMWQEIAPPFGKFAITGNHEFYAGLGQSLDFLQRSGFVMLRNRGITVGDVVRLVGIDDEQIRNQSVQEIALLQAQQTNLFTIFLKHRPSINPDDTPYFDLQLSGHTHRGQIFPFNFITALRYPMQDGLYHLASGSLLYTSRGTGTWGPPMRVLSPPEITVFEIKHRNSDS